jgi:hypothetical protein
VFAASHAVCRAEFREALASLAIKRDILRAAALDGATHLGRDLVHGGRFGRVHILYRIGRIGMPKMASNSATLCWYRSVTPIIAKSSSDMPLR